MSALKWDGGGGGNTPVSCWKEWAGPAKCIYSVRSLTVESVQVVKVERH